MKQNYDIKNYKYVWFTPENGGITLANKKRLGGSTFCLENPKITFKKDYVILEGDSIESEFNLPMFNIENPEKLTEDSWETHKHWYSGKPYKKLKEYEYLEFKKRIPVKFTLNIYTIMEISK